MRRRSREKEIHAGTPCRLPAPETGSIIPFPERRMVVFVDGKPGTVPPMDLDDDGLTSGLIDFPLFFAMPAIKADILIFKNIQLLWDEENMERFARSLSAFRKANPKSAIVVDASNSPLFRRLARLHEEGSINSIIDSPMEEGKAVELGIEILAILQD